MWATGPDLRLVVSMNHAVIYDDCPGLEPTIVEYKFNDSEEQEHTLVFEMKNKLPEHTKIDETGQILQDRCINIADLMFDKIELGHLFTENARYLHDHNGTTEPLIDKFYGVMGCNGRVEMQFSTPIYLWLLENM